MLGAVFSLFGVCSAGSPQGGLLLGAFMFMAALMLGTDSSTNPGSASRQFYEALLLVTFTLGCVVVGALWRLAAERRWLDVLLAGLKLAVVVLAVMAVTLGNHPRVRRVLGALGFRP